MSSLPSESISATDTVKTAPDTEKAIGAENCAGTIFEVELDNRFLFICKLEFPALKMSGQPSLSKSPTPTITSESENAAAIFVTVPLSENEDELIEALEIELFLRLKYLLARTVFPPTVTEIKPLTLPLGTMTIS
jgi:hypothetical protein